MKYDQLDISNEFNTYFETKEEFLEFSNKVLEKYNDLEKQNFKNINFNINARYYNEYGEIYPFLELVFEYERDLTQEEINIKTKEEKENEIDLQILKELNGKLSSNSIGSIINNEDLKKLYLEGKIII